LKRNKGTRADPDIVDVEEINIELYSKEKALEELGKYIGLYEADNKQKAVKIDLSGLNFEELLKLKQARKI
jgi:hypothetical protein